MNLYRPLPPLLETLFLSRKREKKKILQQNGPFQPQTIVINPHSIEAVDRIIYLELVANDHVPYELLFNINATRC